MKRKLSVILLCIATALCSAQTSFYAADNSQAYGDNAIVRSWDNGNAAITYYEVGLNRYVQYVNYTTGDSYRTEVPDYLEILDMYIMDDTVYYCGYSVLDTGGRGVVGYFDPSDFFNPINHVRFRTLQVPPLTHVRKLVAQKNPITGAIEIIALGENKWYDTVFDATGHMVALHPHLDRYFLFCKNIRSFTTQYIIALVNANEHYYDVLLTDNIVVFVGIATYLTYNMICFRTIDRANAIPPTTTSSSLDNIYFFPTGNNEVFSAMHSTSMQKDSIATAYMHINATTGDVSNRIRIFDIAIMENVYSQEYIVPDKSEVTDIEYIPADKSLVCMQDFITPSGTYNTNFVYIDPFATSNYLTNIEYIKSTFYTSMTRKGGKHYLASHGTTWFLKDKFSTGPYSDETCPLDDKYEVLVIDKANAFPISLNWSPSQESKRKYLVSKDITSRTVFVICSNQ